MRDIFFTILIIWVLWRIFEGVKRSRTPFTFNTYNDNSPKTKEEGEVTIEKVKPVDKASKQADTGEYVDFEEIKNK